MIARSIDAPAKINLSLRVVGQRDDGYHLLESELALLDLADRLLLLPGSSGLRVEGAPDGSVPLDGSNLAWRGLVAGFGETPALVCLTLEKRIPAAAGLGGGSSDAAAAWRLGRSARGVDAQPTEQELRALVDVGADVPFFGAGVPAARVTGIGEHVAPTPPMRREVILVHPPFGLPTRDVFAELRPEEWGTADNDLLGPARRLRPELDDLFGAIRRAGGTPRLTGSGPTIFVMEQDAERGRAVADGLRREGLRITVTRTRTEAAAISTLDDEHQEA